MNQKKINIDFPYEIRKARVSKQASNSIRKGLFLAIFTGFAIAVILIFLFVPTAAQAFDDINVGMNTIFILLLIMCSGTVWYFINRSAKG